MTETKQGVGAEGYRGRWSAIVEAAVDAIIVIDGRGRIQSFNPAAQGMFGFSEEEIVGKNVSALMPEPDSSRHGDYIANYERTGDARIIGRGREVVARHRDGDCFPIHLSVGKFDSDGVRGYVGIIHDISKRRAAERELEIQRDRLAQVSRLTTVGEMASGLAHEVNQPLSAIANYTRALELMIDKESASPETVREIVAKIGKQSQRAGDVIRRMRRFAAQRETHLERVDLHDLIEETLKLAETDAGLHQREIAVELGERSVTLEVDPVQFQQVLLNLVRNGLEAMQGCEEREAQLTVRLDLDERRANVHVVDRGAGIPAEKAERLFSPFFSTKRDGMGLGLTISRSIVESYGGSLSFAPGADGVGSVFTMQLPLNPRGHR